MPVIRREDGLPGTTPTRLELQARLAEELKRTADAAPAGDPTIVEQRLGGTGRWSVSVVWSQWNGLKPIERDEVIRGAYREAARPDGPSDDRIVISEGLDWGNPRVESLLPYRISAFRMRYPDRIDEEAHRALLEEGAVLVGETPLLRVADETAARELVRRLRRKQPDQDWFVERAGSAPVEY